MRLLTEWTFNDKENILISEIKVPRISSKILL